MFCETCNQIHTGSYGTGRFCSSKCSHSFATKAKRSEINRKVSEALQGRITSPNTLFSVGQPPKNPPRHLTVRLWAELWIAGKASRPSVTTRRVRKAMLALYGAKCQTCGWAKINPSTDKVPVQLHHIDGDDTNNVLENVELLCPNCHSLTPNFMALNMSLENRAKAKNYFKKLAREEEVESPPRDLEAL